MFVSREVIPVSDDQGNTIYIKARMDLGTRNRVIGDAVKIQGVSETDINIGAYQTALLIHNIVRWEGPAFAGVPCTPDNVERLEPAEPLVERVLNEINQRNAKSTTDPKDSTSNGVAPLAEESPALSANGASMSTLPSATTGRQRK